MQIEGSHVLLTGASGGLGRAIAKELARRGAHLTLTARNAEVLGQLADDTGGEVIVCDLDDRTQVASLFEHLDDTDVLIANAGIGGGEDGLDTSTEEIDRVLDVNLRAPMVLTTEFARRHSSQRGPDGGAAADADSEGLTRSAQVVLVGSLAGLVTSPTTSLYNATKFGLRGFSLAIRQDVEAHGVGVSLIAPGFIRDEGMFADGGVDLPRFVRTKSPQDVADAVVSAIVTNPPEVFVSPLELRASAMLGAIAPGLSEAIQRRLGVEEMTADR
ncbi:MAG: SDR family NAD(P)-dependent oxidoreductase [Microthrixaceae bacterium]